MSREDISHLSVIGAGNMGHGIAQVAAMAGYDVTLRDIEEDLVRDGYENIEWSLGKLDDQSELDEPADAILDRIETTVDLPAAVEGADLVIEAVPEKLPLKRDIFETLDAHAPPETILASNTSSLSITEIGSATDRREKVVGTHFFNPPVKMDLVEIVYGEHTGEETIDTVERVVESFGKTPIHVRKDVHGFVVNNVLLPFMMEAAWMLSEGETTVEAADAAMVHQRGYPMGPFELADMTGLDVGHDVYVEGGRPVPPALAERVEAGDLGRKTGRGYYDYGSGNGVEYEPGDGEEFDTLRVEARMVNAAARLVGEDVATPEDVDLGMELGAGFPEGICRRGDGIGLDVVRRKMASLYDATGENRYEPHPYLETLVAEGRTGPEVGRGFFEYGTGASREYQYLDREITDGVLAVEIDRLERHNALSVEAYEELRQVFADAPVEEIRCATIEGRGDRAFSAGTDIEDFLDARPPDMMAFTEPFETISEFPRPVVAKIDGLCLGGGFEVALSCDLRIATERSEFGFPEITLGLIPGGGGTQRLLRMVGPTRARELVYRGNRIEAARAEEWGIINRAVPHEEFEDTVERFLSDIREGPPIALQVAKRVLDNGGDAALDAGIALEGQGFGVLMATDDVSEGVEAFLDGRDPEFEGR